ncbi:MAG TPA: hypothetical protein DHW45_08705 [Candidatus Latescibacteria bacterium]|nr:hypothetical protein [Candidatus Latescibacterota bacterium]
MSLNTRDSFERDGYVVVRGVLDPEKEVAPFKKAYTALIDSLSYVYLGRTGVSVSEYDALPLPERFATLLAISRGRALHHLDPVLNSFLPHYSVQSDLPGAQIPALFDFISRPALIDVIESLIGPEITTSPVYHINFKLAQKHLNLVEELVDELWSGASQFDSEGVTNTQNADPALERFYGFQVGKTDWHMDAISGLYDSHDSEIVNAWIPINSVTEENGCLLVIPGSHNGGVRGAPFDSEELKRAVPILADPGDVIVLHNKVLHSATENVTPDGFRWAFNFRYHPTGHPSGRPFLPGFITRSRVAPETELKNPYLWGAMWNCALIYLTENGSPFDYMDLRNGRLDLEYAREITSEWAALAPGPKDWLAL